MIQSQGKRANTNGRSAEDVIESILKTKHYKPKRQHLIGPGIYGAPLRADFYINDARGFPLGLVIESKWQEVTGSADEKLPYLVANIQECYPCPVVIVIGGGGSRDGAIRWLRSQVRGNLYGVFSLEGFLTWVNHTL